LFGGIGGYGVIHYLPLDGTVFKDSRSVDSEPFIGMASLGFSVRYRRFALSYALTYFTETFETERENPEFGTVSLSWYY
jgi:lipid A 3-O-deacylase